MKDKFWYEQHGRRFVIEFNGIEPGVALGALAPSTWLDLEPLESVDFRFSLAYSKLDGVLAYRLFVDSELVMGTATDFQQFLDAAAKKIHWHVAKESLHEFFIHCGVVGVCGRAVLLPGKSFAGKSTLVRSLVGLGSVYYSDEYALLTREAPPRVAPFPREISLRPDMYDALPLRQVAQGGVPPVVSVESIYFLNYTAQVDWRVEPVSAGQASLMMFQHSLAAQTFPVELLAALGQLCATVPCYQGVRGEADVAGARLLEEVDSRLRRG